MRRVPLAVGVVLVVLGIFVGSIPLSAEAHQTVDDFVREDGDAWAFSPIIALRAGLSFNVSWVSNRSLTLGIGTPFEISNYQFGISSEPKLIASASGTTGNLSVVIPQSGSYRLAMKWDEGGPGPVQVTLDIYATLPNAYIEYAILLAVIGIVLIVVGVFLSSRMAKPGPGTSETDRPSTK